MGVHSTLVAGLHGEAAKNFTDASLAAFETTHVDIAEILHGMIILKLIVVFLLVTALFNGGGRGIRTPEGLHPTRFPSERHRPLGDTSKHKFEFTETP